MENKKNLNCIAQCSNTDEIIVRSHIIPNFVRTRLTGQNLNGTKKFTFRFLGDNKLVQDLPKPKLLCKKCDNEVLGKLEKKACNLFLPKANQLKEITLWEKENLVPGGLYGIFDNDEEPFTVAQHRLNQEQQGIINKFSISVAWRALHEMATNINSLSAKFLLSEFGKKTDKAVRDYLFNNGEPQGFSCQVSMYYLGVESAAYISTRNDEMPFAWNEFGTNNDLEGVAVIFGMWVIVWTLYDGDLIDLIDHREALERKVFNDWVESIRSELSKSKI